MKGKLCQFEPGVEARARETVKRIRVATHRALVGRRLADYEAQQPHHLQPVNYNAALWWILLCCAVAVLVSRWL